MARFVRGFRLDYVKHQIVTVGQWDEPPTK